MEFPWSRIKEYMNLLSSLKQHSPKEHPDQAYIAQVLNKMQEVYLYFKKVFFILHKYQFFDNCCFQGSRQSRKKVSTS